MHSCPPERELERLLGEELPDIERSRAEAHIETCPRCQACLQQLVTQHPSALGTGLAAALGGSPHAEPLPGDWDFLRRLASAARPESSPAGRAAASGTGEVKALPEVEGYEILGEIGRGAVAIVYRARHLELNRLVALKMILAGPFSSPNARQRFRIESQAIARLRHPHIVQVYEIGEQGECLYLSLELVDGGNLADSIAAGPRPALESARIAADLAEAIAYAHAHGVIHRDLKPANVLFRGTGVDPNSAGRRGAPALQSCELKITDFGLAKVSAEAGATADGVTLSGEFLGTPSYTAPEQARGDLGRVGPQADVFSLGAILYELLTGRPPFQGASVVETLLQVAHHVPVPPARLVPGVPRDLDTICSKCLEKDPAQRYATADALAADLRRFLSGEPILARRLGPAQRALRWVRRRPARAGVLAGSLLVALGLLGAGLWIGLQSAALDREVSAHLQELGQRAESSDWEGARTALERAKARLGEDGSRTLRDRVDDASRDLELVARLDAIRSNRAALAEGRFDIRRNYARADGEYEQCFLEAGIGRVNEDANVVASRVRASQVQRALVAALDDWALCCSTSSDAERAVWLGTVAQQADGNPSGWLGRVRDPDAWSDRAALEELARTSGEARPGVQLMLALGARVEALGGDAVPLLKQVQREHPDDFWANLSLGDVLTWERPAEAIRYYQAALAIRPHAAVAYNNLGRALVFHGNTAEAVEHFQRALQIDPRFAQAWSDLGNTFVLQERTSEALEANREAVRLAPGSPSARVNLGRALTQAGRWAEAVEEFSRALELEPESATAHNNLALSLVRVGRASEAIEHGERAVELAPEAPGNHNNLGLALRATAKLADAAARFQKAIELNPGEIDARTNLSSMLSEQGRLDEAIELAEQALRLDPDGATSNGTLGMALLQKDGRRDEAIELLERAAAADPGNPTRHNNLAIGLQFAGRLDEAIAHYQRALEINPRMTRALGALSTALVLRGRWEEARAAAQRALESSAPDDPRRAMAERVVEQCDLALAVEARLPAILDGSAAPADAAEALQFARVCASKKLHAGGARLYASAFAASPTLAEDLDHGDRYNAACCAAVVASGSGEAGHDLPEAERTEWRRRALQWLRADLAAHRAQIENVPETDRTELLHTLVYWLVDPDLASLRDEEALAGLPEDEREQCRALWRAVDELKRLAEQAP